MTRIIAKNTGGAIRNTVPQLIQQHYFDFTFTPNGVTVFSLLIQNKLKQIASQN